jgi:hypothetical protein
MFGAMSVEEPHPTPHELKRIADALERIVAALERAELSPEEIRRGVDDLLRPMRSQS